MNEVLSINNLFVNYGHANVLEGVSFNVARGDFIGMAGPNGAGKTTLIKAILGLIPISSGTILLLNTDLKRFTQWEKIGYLPQKTTSVNALFPAKITEVVTLGLLSQKRWPKGVTRADYIRIDEILKELGIFKLKNSMMAELSGGQQQKVLLARALVSKPEIIIFDEPSTALDPESRNEFFNLIKKINRDEKITVIIITHDTGYIGQFASKLLYIDKKVVYYGKIDGFCPPDNSGQHFEKSNNHIIWHQHN